MTGDRPADTVTHDYKNNAESSEYATPPSLWRPLSKSVNGFDVDPASGAESTPIAETRYTKEDDGLSKVWHGDVWLNPPWGDKQGGGGGENKERWLNKARNEAARDAVRTVTVLIVVDPTTEWFQKHVIEAPLICLLNSRIQFEGESSDLPYPLCIAVFGSPPDELRSTLETMGAVFRGREYHRSTMQSKLPKVTADE